MWPRLPLAIAIVVVGLVATASGRQDSSSVTPQAQAQFRAVWAQQSRVALDVPGDGARIVIVKFNDYECPTCALAEAWYGPVIARFEQAHPGAVKLVYKDWPWNMACNPHAGETIPGHEGACAAAQAARLARDRGKFDAMKEWLFAHQDIGPAAIAAEARQMLGLADFEQAAAGTLGDIQRDVTQGDTLKVQSTPTYFINGVRLPDRLIIPELFGLALDIEWQGTAGAAH